MTNSAMNVFKRFSNYITLTVTEELLEAGVIRFHEHFNKREFSAIYEMAHNSFRHNTSKDAFFLILELMHKRLGTFQCTGKPEYQVFSEFVPHLNTYKRNVTATINTQFVSGKATETFDYRVYTGGERSEVKLYDYSINTLSLTRRRISR